MSDRVQTVEQIVKGFSPDELKQFSDWFADFQDQLWEMQIERDSLDGKLDSLIRPLHIN